MNQKIRNPKWSSDEIIITLNFYHKNYPKIPEKSSIEIKELSEFLGKLNVKLGVTGNENLRNPNGVYMKLMNFHHFNTEHEGDGLKGGSKLDEKIWNEYLNKKEYLNDISKTIYSLIDTKTLLPEINTDYDVNEANEGKVLYRVHRYRERNRKIIENKKNEALKRFGCLKCEGCGFDFKENYEDHGSGFIECHHTKPVSKMKVGERTKLNDLSLLCSNCHRMVHTKKPWLSIDQLKNILITTKRNL